MQMAYICKQQGSGKQLEPELLPMAGCSERPTRLLEVAALRDEDEEGNLLSAQDLGEALTAINAITFGEEPSEEESSSEEEDESGEIEELVAAKHFQKVLPKAAIMQRERVVKVAVPLRLGEQAGKEDEVDIDKLVDGV